VALLNDNDNWRTVMHRASVISSFTFFWGGQFSWQIPCGI